MKELRTTKDKLLEIIGDFAVDDLGIDRLLDVLADKLQRQGRDIEQLLHKNDGEWAHIRQERETLQREYQELRRNPATIITGPYFFYSPQSNEKFMIQINRGRVETFQKKKNNRHLLQEISLAEYEAKI